MQLVEEPDAFSRALDRARDAGASIGLVPTMGALHAGHRSLIERAVAARDHVAVSIFVNPLQFDRREDLDRYPRTLDADVSLCADAGVSTVFAPRAAAMFPADSATSVSVAGISARWEGASRPGHFDGVTTVVAKLFALAGPCAAYFGEKDFQQLAVVRRMATDLFLPVTIIGCPTVREPDGLALSSRNAHLSADERLAARVLWRALVAGRDAVASKEDRPGAVADTMAAVIGTEPLARLDYAAAVDAEDFTVPRSLDAARELRLLVAAVVGAVRLIDNCDARVPSVAVPRRAGRGDRSRSARAALRRDAEGSGD